MKFLFENLDVYQKSVLFASRINQLAHKLKGRIPFSTLDQLLRASLSVSLNLAEGNGRWHTKEKKHFFWISRGSLFEVVPLIQVIRNSGHLPEGEYDRLYEEIRSMAKMMTNLIKAVEKVAPSGRGQN